MSSAGGLVGALERRGDRVCHICEYVIWCASGRDLRHVDIEQVKRDARRSIREQELVAFAPRPRNRT